MNTILVNRIYAFLDKYACIRLDFNHLYDDKNEKYTSPDASIMKHCADMISKGYKPDNCWSDWSSGGYQPYASKEGRQEHDDIRHEINNIHI